MVSGADNLGVMTYLPVIFILLALWFANRLLLKHRGGSTSEVNQKASSGPGLYLYGVRVFGPKVEDESESQ